MECFRPLRTAVSDRLDQPPRRLLYISSATLHQYLYSAAKEITHGRATWGAAFPPSSRISSGQLLQLVPAGESFLLLLGRWFYAPIPGTGLSVRRENVIVRTIEGSCTSLTVSASSTITFLAIWFFDMDHRAGVRTGAAFRHRFPFLFVKMGVLRRAPSRPFFKKIALRTCPDPSSVMYVSTPLASRPGVGTRLKTQKSLCGTLPHRL